MTILHFIQMDPKAVLKKNKLLGKPSFLGDHSLKKGRRFSQFETHNHGMA